MEPGPTQHQTCSLTSPVARLRARSYQHPQCNIWKSWKHQLFGKRFFTWFHLCWSNSKQIYTFIPFSINVCLLKFESHQNTRKTATFCEFSQNWIRIITTTQRFQSLLKSFRHVKLLGPKFQLRAGFLRHFSLDSWSGLMSFASVTGSASLFFLTSL